MLKRQSCKVRNDLNPIWNVTDSCTNMSFGVQRAGEPLNISVWDADSGLEFGDDLVGTAMEYVIPCSILDSIDEPKTAWNEGELDPIAIKSNGKTAVPWRRQTKEGYRLKATCKLKNVKFTKEGRETLHSYEMDVSLIFL